MSNDSHSISALLADLKAGDQVAANELFARYLPRVSALARKCLANAPGHVSEDSDVAQSALLTFWKKVQRGGLKGELNRHRLWGLLATITVRKAGKHKRRHGKENISAEVDLNGMDLATLFSTTKAVDCDLVAEERLQSLAGDLRSIAILRLFHYTNAEIAAILGCAERTVERKLNHIRRIWQKELDQEL